MAEPQTSRQRSRRRPARRNKAVVAIARERMDYLFELVAAEAAKGDDGDWDLADRAVRLARAIGMRYNLRPAPEQKLRVCGHCHAYLAPGRTARVRLRRGTLTVYCAGCGQQNRRGYGNKRATQAEGEPAAGVEREE